MHALRSAIGAKRYRSTCVLLLAGVLTVGCGGGDGSSAPLASCYSITISGTVNGLQFGTSQSKLARLFVADTLTQRTRNGVNPIDVFLQYEQPSSLRVPGAIEFATNAAFFPSGSARASFVDLAFVNFDPDVLAVSVEPDPSRFLSSFLNRFTSAASFAPTIFSIQQGIMQIQFQDEGNTVEGIVNVLGQDNNAQIQDYAAQFSGTADGFSCPAA